MSADVIFQLLLPAHGPIAFIRRSCARSPQQEERVPWEKGRSLPSSSWMKCGGSLQLGECEFLTEKRFLNNTGDHAPDLH